MITVSISDLKAAIKVLGSIVKSKNDPLMMTCGVDDLCLDTFVGECKMSTSIPFQGIRFRSETPIAVYFREFKAALSNFPDEGSFRLSYDVEEDIISVQGIRLTCTTPRDFPAIEGGTIITKESIPINYVKDIISISKFADQSGARGKLGGVFFDGYNKMVATNGRVLKVVVLSKKPIIPEMILSVEAVGALKVFSPVVEMVPVYLQKVITEGKGKKKSETIIESLYRVQFTDGKSVLTTTLIEGPYPNYKQCIPGPSKKTISFSKKELLEVIKDATPLIDKNFHLIKFMVRNGKVALHLHQRKSLKDKISKLVFYQKLQSSFSNCDWGFKIGFNAEYLKSLLDTIKSDKIVLSFTKGCGGDLSVSPVLINKDESKLTSLIMPLQIQE